MGASKQATGTDVVLLVNASGCPNPELCSVAGSLPVEVREVTRDEVAAYLRSHPFDVRAVLVSGDGESPLTAIALDAIKGVSPRLPIVFLDSKQSSASELRVRQAGVHYYAHSPASPGEIDAVLAGLGAAGRRHRR